MKLTKQRALHAFSTFYGAGARGPYMPILWRRARTTIQVAAHNITNGVCNWLSGFITFTRELNPQHQIHLGANLLLYKAPHTAQLQFSTTVKERCRLMFVAWVFPSKFTLSSRPQQDTYSSILPLLAHSRHLLQL